jgi:DnaK suppressor protein
MSKNPQKDKGLSEDQIEQIREALVQKREELRAYQNTQLSALHAQDKHHIADLEEMASDTVDTDSLCALVDLGSSTLSEIEVALGRIDEGSYGLCERCEKPIGVERLEARPFASLCLGCQRKKEERRVVEEWER